MTDESPGRLGTYVRAWRARAGLSQRALAAEAGIAESSIALIETGRRGASDETLDALVVGLGLSAGEAAQLRQARDERKTAHLSNRALLERMLAELAELRAQVEELRGPPG